MDNRNLKIGMPRTAWRALSKYLLNLAKWAARERAYQAEMAFQKARKS